MCLSGQSVQESYRFLLRFSYLGTRYSGVQRQKVTTDGATELPTIQAALEAALNCSFRLETPAVLAVSSRTDTGVHAVQNTAHVDLVAKFNQMETCRETILVRVNNFLLKHGQDIILRDVLRVPHWFHSRYCAHKRTYIYRIAVPKQFKQPQCLSQLPIEEKNRCYEISSPVDIELMQRGCKLFEGFHDFLSFQSTTKDPKPTQKCIQEFSLTPENVATRRHIQPELADLFSWWRFTVCGRSFLYRQVRRMVGSIIAIGHGAIPIEEISRMLSAADKMAWNPRIKLAPAHGLYLLNVDYDPQMLDLESPPPSWRPPVPYRGKILQTPGDSAELSMTKDTPSVTGEASPVNKGIRS